uniref:C2H2-type domain-containing protein n=1 Tax=Panagrellus redivivus TaxID=6233 RepID=A0A7E4W835_PANRE
MDVAAFGATSSSPEYTHDHLDELDPSRTPRGETPTSSTSSMPPNVTHKLEPTSPGSEVGGSGGKEASSDASTSDSPPPVGMSVSPTALGGSSGSGFGVLSGGGGSGDASGSLDVGTSFSCVSCHRKFPTAKLLQSHNQAFHTDKSFICETCGKAFRFRSNLAEHRSVHTAMKPFVCKFCGKSSRLKGNLTKHILKHHKKEQSDYIGTDEIIINKKGKKSVKDPIAVEFLENSMYVATNGARAPSIAESISGSSTPMSAIGATSLMTTTGCAMNYQPQSIEEQQRNFLLSIGVEPESLNVKAESPESDSSIGSHNRTTNELLEKCNAYANMDVDPSPSASADTTADIFAQLAAESSSMGGASSAAAAVATLASMVANNNNSIASRSGNMVPLATSTPKIFDEANLLAALQVASTAFSTPSSSGASSGKKTQCPECGKHMRKPKDLVTHLSTIHRKSPEAISQVVGSLSNTSTSSTDSGLLQNTQSFSTSGGTGSGSPTHTGDYGMAKLTDEVKNTNKMLAEMKAARNFATIITTVNTMDARIGRLEKQLEMVLSTLYTLVQLQAGPLAAKK